MKIKLDENIGRRGVELLKATGHDVMTVYEQALQGSPDEVIFRVCADEERVLITLDHDFGQVLRFPPERSAGVVILEPGAGLTAQSLLARLQEFLVIASTYSPKGSLWIMEPGRVRMHVRAE